MVTAIPYRRGAGVHRDLITIKDDHQTDYDGHCARCLRAKPSRWAQSGARMRDHPLPAAPVWQPTTTKELP